MMLVMVWTELASDRQVGARQPTEVSSQGLQDDDVGLTHMKPRADAQSCWRMCHIGRRDLTNAHDRLSSTREGADLPNLCSDGARVKRLAVAAARAGS
jgi:hypothetical protein